jgi:hypothetical protein
VPVNDMKDKLARERNMPDGRGWEGIEGLRAAAETASIPLRGRRPFRGLGTRDIAGSAGGVAGFGWGGPLFSHCSAWESANEM